jgi:hypothetical protein
VTLDNNAAQSPVGCASLPSHKRVMLTVIDAPALTNGTYQSFVLGDYPYSFDLVNTAPSYDPEAGVPASAVPPAGYNVVGLNAGFAQSGFAVARGALVWTDGAFHGFAACYVAGIAPYEAVGPEVQLLWRNATAGAPSGSCADVELEVVPV